jgi:hypothetical protein
VSILNRLQSYVIQTTNGHVSSFSPFRVLTIFICRRSILVSRVLAPWLRICRVHVTMEVSKTPFPPSVGPFDRSCYKTSPSPRYPMVHTMLDPLFLVQTNASAAPLSTHWSAPVRTVRAKHIWTGLFGLPIVLRGFTSLSESHRLCLWLL